MKIGYTIQNVNIFLTFQDCNFKIGNSNKCKKYMTDYLSYYNSDLSFYCRFSDYYGLIPEFRHVEETIYA